MAVPRSGIPAPDPAPQDATVAALTAASLAVTGASTLGTVTATSVSAPHSGLTGVTADQHHAQSHGHTGADGSGTVAHSATTGRTANDHHNQAHVVTGADHTASGLTAGHVLRATGATTFAFGALADSDVPATIARDTEVTTAVSDHAALADPHTGYQKESEKAVANGYASLGSDGKVPTAQLPVPVAGASSSVAGAAIGTSFADADSTNLSIVLTTAARRVLIGFQGSVFLNADVDLAVDLTIDTVRQGGTNGLAHQSSGTVAGWRTLSFTFLSAVLSAGSHTFRIQARRSGAGAVGALGSTDDPAKIWVVEQMV